MDSLIYPRKNNVIVRTKSLCTDYWRDCEQQRAVISTEVRKHGAEKSLKLCRRPIKAYCTNTLNLLSLTPHSLFLTERKQYMLIIA